MILNVDLVSFINKNLTLAGKIFVYNRLLIQAVLNLQLTKLWHHH